MEEKVIVDKAARELIIDGINVSGEELGEALQELGYDVVDMTSEEGLRALCGKMGYELEPLDPTA